jgi:hypothetical protein
MVFLDRRRITIYTGLLSEAPMMSIGMDREADQQLILPILRLGLQLYYGHGNH